MNTEITPTPETLDKMPVKEEILDTFLQGDDMWPSTKTKVKKAMDKWSDIKTTADRNRIVELVKKELSILNEKPHIYSYTIKTLKHLLSQIQKP